MIFLLFYALLWSCNDRPVDHTKASILDCWMVNNVDSEYLENRDAIGFIFANNKIIITNPKCKSDHYRLSIDQREVPDIRRNILRKANVRNIGDQYPLAFKAKVYGKAIRERGIKLFLGRIESALMLPENEQIKAYADAGGK